MKFAHLADCHLGSWISPELKSLNFQSFSSAIDICIKQKVDFILIAGDLFDSPYPSIDTLKETFNEFRKLKEESIPVFIIAGSHDYSVSGKTFLDVLEKAGFCENVAKFEEKDKKIILQPTIYKNVAIYGYPGKKSSLEAEEISKIKIQDSPGLFKILMLHTAIKGAVSNIPVKSVDESLLPKVDYVALGHLHINYKKGNLVYAGPTFPNNLSELEELKSGFFYIFDSGEVIKKEIKLKEIYVLNLEIKNMLDITEKIISFLEKQELKDKVVILKLSGIVEQGKISDIEFSRIGEYLKKKEVFAFLKSTTKLFLPHPEVKLINLKSENLEESIINDFQQTNQNKFNFLINPLIKSLQMEKLEEEKLSVFEERLGSEVKKILEI